MHPKRMLFTRQQMSELTAIPEDVLNYWMRENVVRAAEGGGGKGQHRRFKYTEINLAAILNEVRGFGANLSSLKELAKVFHASADWAEDKGMAPDDLRLISLIQSNRAQFNKHGFYPAPAADFPDRQPDGKSDFTGKLRVHLRSWDDVVEWMSRSLFYIDELGAKFDARHFEWADTVSPDLIDTHWGVLRRIASIPATADADSFPLILARSSGGEWALSSGTSAEISALVSFIGINTSRLIYEMWNR